MTKPRKNLQRMICLPVMRTVAEAQAALTEITVEFLTRCEAGCNRCGGNGTSWWQQGTGACGRCGGTGTARSGYLSAIKAATAAVEHAASPYARLTFYVDSTRFQHAAGAPADLRRSADFIIYDGAKHVGMAWGGDGATLPGGTLGALFAAVLDGRQTGPVSVATAEKLVAERTAQHKIDREARAARQAQALLAAFGVAA